ncbi:hypothetical protein CONPUDRAFT_153087 [Coniophora puteana RWD-64-598 SS2]|uniref:Uncharacterized protein n=1 Tax=Coniophora puteana (strain RWD-64-598) TaxID=741705 RepID=A0A5M3MSQ4_CONPW|nr:uncharacterized protein CONPUDRAFT_153087 [Coniophora puteana RWD-64-598 SS2]EIW82199.1 hypothetical protein CONPUDRAFT_153087 [Coniophora puteana RWD-64-598 SS2]
MPSLFSSESSPRLPPFERLLVLGSYPVASPIHLCISVLAELASTSAPNTESLRSLSAQHHALIISPSRPKLLAGLRDVQRAPTWVRDEAGTGRVMGLARGVQLFYPATPGELAALLLSLRTDAHGALDNKMTLAGPPALVVLHEPSSYFLDGWRDSEWTVSSYLMLVVHVLGTLAFLTSKEQRQASRPASRCAHPPHHDAPPDSCPPIRFALFDSRLHTLKLPVVRVPPPGPFEDTGPERAATSGEGDDAAKDVLVFVRRYFEWVVTFEPESDPGSTDTEMAVVRTARLHNEMAVSPDEDLTWKWLERTSQDGVLLEWN